jgi:DNA primase
MGRLSEETIQQVIAASDIVAVVQSYFPLRKAGSAYKAVCPFHSERTPSFQVNPARQIFKCFGCGAGGGVVKFVELYEHVSFPDAVRRLAERAGIPIVESEDSAEELGAFRQRKELLGLHRAIADWFHQLLLTDRQAEPARRYWKSRGLDGQVARRWKIGFAPPDPTRVLAWARENAIRDDLLAEGGFMLFTDDHGRRRREPWFRFAGRLMFPINNEQGEVIAFSGRLLDPEAQAAKYLNSPETPIFNKSRVFFGLDRARRAITREKRSIICEGQLDLITCVEAGIEAMVAPLGTAFTEHHARRLHQLADETVLCFDSDTAGVKAAARAFAILARAGIHVRVAELPAGDDPDSLVRREGADALRARLDAAPAFFDFQLAHLTRSADLTQVRDRLRIAADLAQGIASLTEKAAQEDAINRTATRLAIPPDDVRKLVVRAARDTARERRHDEARDQPKAATADTEAAIAPDDGPALPDNRAVVWLCRLVLIDTEARDWLRQTDHAWLADLPGTEFLRRLLLEAAFNPADHAALTLFLATLTPRQQDAAHALLAETSPSHGLAEARAAFYTLKGIWLRGRIDQIKARQAVAALSTEELHRLAFEEIKLRSQAKEAAAAAALARLPATLAPF